MDRLSGGRFSSTTNYTVKAGDTLSGIAELNGSSIEELLERNPEIADRNRIRAGTSLTLREAMAETGASEAEGFDLAALFDSVRSWFSGGAEVVGVESTTNQETATQEILPWRELILDSSTRHGVSPALVSAVISRESNGRNIIGDGGHGRGLMQIDDRWHGEFLEANSEGLNPATNIDYGTKLLRNLTREFEGNLSAAIAAYNQGSGNVWRRLRAGEDVDRGTTGGDYSADVLRRMELFQQIFIRSEDANRL